MCRANGRASATAEITAMRGLAYPELAARVMAPFVAPSLTEDELLRPVHPAYGRFRPMRR
jgi:threonine synthase